MVNATSTQNSGASLSPSTPLNLMPYGPWEYTSAAQPQCETSTEPWCLPLPPPKGSPRTGGATPGSVVLYLTVTGPGPTGQSTVAHRSTRVW